MHGQHTLVREVQGKTVLEGNAAAQGGGAEVIGGGGGGWGRVYVMGIALRCASIILYLQQQASRDLQHVAA